MVVAAALRERAVIKADNWEQTVSIELHLPPNDEIDLRST